MKQYCPNCHGELEYESIGMKCTKCKGFIDMHGNFHKYVEKPFMPPKTNFDKITESVESLAEFIEKYATNCNYCPLYKLEKCDIKGWKFDKEYCKKEIIKWLQKESENG